MILKPIELRAFEDTDFEAYPRVKCKYPLIGEIRVTVGDANFDGLMIVDSHCVFIDLHTVEENGKAVKFGDRVVKDMYLKVDMPDFQVATLLASQQLNIVPLTYLQQIGFRHVAQEGG